MNPPHLRVAFVLLPRGSMLPQRLVLPVVCALLATPAAAQEPQPLSGRAVYELVSNSVFLVQTEAEDGEPLWQGTAFLIGDKRLVTNAHVIREGKVFIKGTGFKIECRIDIRDELNDLALLTAPGLGSARPLRLATELPKPGEIVYAIGNPQGLERTISQGLYSGPRSVEGQDLLQVSASISEGSSGGPVVNGAGELVGVAVSYLQEGQNLNFAVPLAAVRTLISGGRSDGRSVETLLAFVRRLQDERSDTGVSTDPSSAYQQLNRRISRILSDALLAAGGKPDSLLMVTETAGTESTAIALQAAEQAVEITKGADPQARLALARALRTKAVQLNGTERDRLLRSAEDHAATAVKTLRSPLADHFSLLATIEADLSDKLNDSYVNYKRALELRRRSQPDEISHELFQLFDVARRLSKPQEARRWFEELNHTGKAMSSHYESYAAFLRDAGDYRAAGDAYVQAAAAQGGTYDALCKAAGSFRTDASFDSALAAARRCIELGAVVKDSEANVASAHNTISQILVERGVYDEAIAHAKQAIAIAPGDGWAYYTLARGLRLLGRYDEAIAAAKNALRVTDGKYAAMHSELGSAYSSLENWPLAASAFRKAAEMEPANALAAYNVATALYNQKAYRESLAWWEEVLKRDPKYPDRASVLQTIQAIRRPS
jgi:tetratricopeptide (TPR) repeat protein